jgi:SAM-dependent methyltransferase
VELHADRRRAQSFGEVAELYDRARPDYPPTLVDALLEDGARDVLDVGSGTGIAAALLAARGCAVLCVEPDPRMAARARARGLDVEIAAFERWDARGRRFDLLTAAQAWHWVDPDEGPRRAAELLRSGGRLAVFWNTGDPPAHVRVVLDPIYDRLEPALEQGTATAGARRRDSAGSAAERIAASGRFAPARVRRFAWSREYDAVSWRALLATHSDHRTLGPERRRALLDAIEDALRGLGGPFVLRYETVLVDARRLSRP